MEGKTFEAVLIRPEGAGTWTYLTLPFSVPDAFGAQGQVAVRGSINGHPYRSTLMPAGDGTHFLVVKKEIRDAVGAAPGSRVSVVLEVDTAERTAEVPADLAVAIAANPAAEAAFAGFTYSKKKEYVDWVEASKREATRRTRVASAVERIAKGLRLKG